MLIKNKPMKEYAAELLERVNNLIRGLEFEAEGLKDFLDATEEDEKHLENWYVLNQTDDCITAIEETIENIL